LPFLDHPLVELAATIPADVKFEGGTLKRVLKAAFHSTIPESIAQRTDKMGFPTPLSQWVRSDARDFVIDVLSSGQALGRDLVDNRLVVEGLDGESDFGRNVWGALSLELWQQEFHDRAGAYRNLISERRVVEA
jgi:asparagine synthase (glutamine-hydrolysing)